MAQLDRIRPQPVLDLPGTQPLPEFVLYPLPNQVADKLCAMYGRYGASQMPSTRYRDLVDLVLIATTSELDALLTLQALQGETERRGCTLPSTIEDPDPHWRAGYSRIARESRLATALQTLDGALVATGNCLNPILSGTATGIWDPATQSWGIGSAPN